MNYKDEATNSHVFHNVKKVLHEKAIYCFTDETYTTPYKQYKKVRNS
ncbi:hypothetical protein [Metabacillus sp. Hm71]